MLKNRHSKDDQGGPERLTEALVESLPVDGRDRIVFDTLQPGFGVRVTPGGTKVYIAQARVGGRPRRVPVGRFPDKKVADARVEARVALADLRGGKDPKVERVARKRAIEAGSITVNALADRWLKEYVRPKLKPRTVADYESLLDQRIRPALGHLPVSKVAKEDVIRLHAELAKTPRRANYVISAFRALMSFAEDVGLREPQSNPAKRIKLYRETLRERFLTEEEIAKAAEAITKAAKPKTEKGRMKTIGPHAAAGLRLALFTGARSGEITAAKWIHFDRERKMIRLPDSKTNTPRTIHLSDAAMEVLAGIDRVGPYIIAGAKKGEPLKNLGRAWIVARKYAGLDDVRLHDLRHSYASLAVSKGASLYLVGKLLGHKVAATTQRYAHLARDAVAAVNDQLGDAMSAAIAKGTAPSAKVVKMPRRKKAV
jgi:integrase